MRSSKKHIAFNKNEDEIKLMISNLNKKLNEIYLGGGKEKIKKQKAKGKLSARERVSLLLDKESSSIEIGAFAGYKMYEEYGGCPAGGVVVVMGYVNKKLCVIVANDPTVKAGSWFPITGKKNLRAQEIAMENKIPIIYLVDSAGVFLPLQDEIFPDKEHFGRIFRNNAKMSASGVTQIAAVMGSCVAGGAYLPIMSDESLIVDKTGTIFLAGSYLVKAAVGEIIDNETLGGAKTHCEISGVTDYNSPNDKSCISTIRDIVGKITTSEKLNFNKIEGEKPKLNMEKFYGTFPSLRSANYDVKEILNFFIDNGDFTEYKATYGKTLVCGYARIDGWSVGIVANQRKVVKNSKSEMQFGGVIYSDSANKASRFIMNCNQKKIPLVFFQDVSGFMVGSRSEHGGIIKDGAKMVNAMANSVVPKFTIIMGNSFGAGNYAMCGKAYDPKLIVGWPTAEIAVMGGEQAAKVLLQIELASLKTKGEKISKEKEKELFENIKSKYDSQIKPYYAASRLWLDAVIDPVDTRKWISLGIEAANNNSEIEDYKTGVIQT